MKIRDGDPLEIYTAGDGEVIFKKYSPIGELSPIAVQYADAMIKHTSCPVLICDRDSCVAAAGLPKREVLERRLSPSAEKYVESRTAFTAGVDEAKPLKALDGSERTASVLIPIISAGDISGAVVLLTPDSGELPNDTDVSLARVAASFLGKQME